MYAEMKCRGIKAVRIIATTFFLCLMLFNVQFGSNNHGPADISLFGLKLSVFVPSAMAQEGDLCGGSCGWCTCRCSWVNTPNCWDPIFVRNCCGCPGQDCYQPTPE